MGTSRPGGYATGRATRASIVTRATEVFTEMGYAGASVREIARRCDISHATLLHHFPNKASLLTAVLHERDLDAAATYRHVETVDDLFWFMIDVATRNEEHPEQVHLYTLLFAEAADPHHPAHEYFRRRGLQRRIVAQRLAVAQRNGELDPAIDPSALAANIAAVWDGLQLHAPLSPVPIDVPAQLELFFARVLGRPLRPRTQAADPGGEAAGTTAQP